MVADILSFPFISTQILDRCSLVTFAAYLPHKGEAYLFLEAPKGLPDKEKAGMMMLWQIISHQSFWQVCTSLTSQLTWSACRIRVTFKWRPLDWLVAVACILRNNVVSSPAILMKAFPHGHCPVVLHKCMTLFAVWDSIMQFYNLGPQQYCGHAKLLINTLYMLSGIRSFLSREGIPVDHLDIRKHIPRDRRHHSKPDTAALFKISNPNSPVKVIKFILRSNPLLVIGIICLQILLILCVLVMIFRH